MDVLPGQSQDFTHTQRAGKGKVHCYIEFAVRAFVQGKTDHIRRPDIPFRILRFREDHIVKGISCNDFPAYRLLKRTPQELDNLFNGLVADIRRLFSFAVVRQNGLVIIAERSPLLLV